MAYGYIYKITNNINKKLYIGLHKSEKFDSSYFGSGVLIKKSIEKYGKENFSIEVLDWADSREELNKKEKYWILHFNSKVPNGYNMTDGGDGGDIFSQLPKDRQDKIREEAKQRMTGRIVSETTREKHRENMLGEKNPMYGKKLSEETKEKISKKLQGENNPMYGRPSPTKGKHLSEETKEKIRQSKLGKNNPMYGRKMSNEDKEYRRQLFSGGNNPRAIKCILYCYETKEKIPFNCIKEALDYLHISQGKYYKDKKNHNGIIFVEKLKQHYYLLKEKEENIIPDINTFSEGILI